MPVYSEMLSLVCFLSSVLVAINAQPTNSLSTTVATSTEPLPDAVRYGKHSLRYITRKYGECVVDVDLDTSTFAEYEGRNSHLLPTDTLKNLVNCYMADANPPTARTLAKIVSRGVPCATLCPPCNVTVRLQCRPYPPAAPVYTSTAGTSPPRYGFQYLHLIKFTGSAFRGFQVTNMTTLMEADDRPLHLCLSVSWQGTCTPAEVEVLARKIFTQQQSESAQHFFGQLASAMKKRQLRYIRFVGQNLHYVKLSNSTIIPLNGEYGSFEAEFA